MPLWLDILALMLIGLIFILVDILLIPGFGFAGLIGIAAMAVACYLAFTTLSPAAGIIVAAASIGLIVLLLKILPRTRMWKHLRLSMTQDKSRGYQVANPEFQNLTGKTGITLTMLRPSGTALINDQRYDVITHGEFIAKDQAIIVTAVDGNKIIVEPYRITP